MYPSLPCCFFHGQPKPLLSLRPAQTVAVSTVSPNRFFAFFAAALVVASLLGGLVPVLAYLGTANKMCLPFVCSLGPRLAASCSPPCYILST